VSDSAVEKNVVRSARRDVRMLHIQLCDARRIALYSYLHPFLTDSPLKTRKPVHDPDTIFKTNRKVVHSEIIRKES
jgi:hypothetical protein